MPDRRSAILGVLAFLASLTGCAPSPAPPAEIPEPTWTEVRLPAAPSDVLIGDVVRCPGRWYVAGGLRDAAGHTRPAVWHSTDARDWQPVPVAASSYYGRQQVMFGLACWDGGIAAIGEKNGGVHGVPRISSWRSDQNGVLTEVPGPAELYGGQRAITVTAIAGRASGWLIAGNRVGRIELPTAAVWRSVDGSHFVPDTEALGLASSERGDSTARGVVAGRSDWFLFGDVRPAGSINRQPAVWTSTGGRVWARASLPRQSADASVTALAVVDDGPMLAMGTLEGVPHAWSYDGSRWSDAGTLGSGASGDGASDGGTSGGDASGGGTSGAGSGPGVGAASVGDIALTVRSSSTQAPAQAYAAVDDGTRWSLWHSPDLRRWKPTRTPAQPPHGAGNRLLLAGSDDVILLAESAASGSRLWVSPIAW